MNQLNSVSSPTPAIINSLNNAINKINSTNAVELSEVCKMIQNVNRVPGDQAVDGKCIITHWT